MDREPSNGYNSDFWQFRVDPSGSYATAVATSEVWESDEGICNLTNKCDGFCLQARRYLTTTAEEFVVCESQIALSGADRDFDCFVKQSGLADSSPWPGFRARPFLCLASTLTKRGGPSWPYRLTHSTTPLRHPYQNSVSFSDSFDTGTFVRLAGVNLFRPSQSSGAKANLSD